MASFLSHQSFFRPSNIPCSQYQKSLRNIVTYASLPARDKIIDFGKYKGRMLGTLPSTYLKWVSNNLRARDFEEWAVLADQVLEDPVYKDRIEWELAEKLLNGDVLNANAKSEGVVAELLEISQRFGWDNDDQLGWRKIDYQLLGTSKGGRIPRVKEKRDGELVKEKRGGGEERGELRGGSSEVGVKERRVERRDRLKMKRGMPNSSRFSDEENGSNYEQIKESSDTNAGVYNPFPGRETLLRKALNRRRLA